MAPTRSDHHSDGCSERLLGESDTNGTRPDKPGWQHKSRDSFSIASNKIGKDLRPEFQQLRAMIKSDVQDLLDQQSRHIIGMIGTAPSPVSADDTSRRTMELYTTASEESTSNMNFAREGEKGLESMTMSKKLAGKNSEANLRAHIQDNAKEYSKEEDKAGPMDQFRTLLPSVPGFVWDFAEKALKYKEPPRKGCLADFVLSRGFETFFTVVIMCHAIFMVVQVNHDVSNPSVSRPELKMIDMFFLLWYTVELFFKLSVHKLYFFWSDDLKWNLLDFTLVTYSYFEILLSKLAGGGATTKATWMRSLRLFRVAKVLRIFRVVKFFKELQMILNCIIGSMLSMVWSVVMLAIMFYMFSLMLVQQTSIFLEEGPSEEETKDLLRFFGSVQTCMWTLFKATFGGDDWNLYFDELKQIGVMACAVWLLFVLFTQIALLNILTGIFVESALEHAGGNDSFSRALEHEQKTREDANELRNLCLEQDKDGSKRMSRAEFERMTEAQELASYLRFIGLEKNHLKMVFDVISGGSDDEDVDINEFVMACMTMRGSAKSADVMSLAVEMARNNIGQGDALYELHETVMEMKTKMDDFPPHSPHSPRSSAATTSRQA